MLGSGFSRGKQFTGIFAAMLIIPLLLAAFAPILAPVPAATAGWSAPPLPDRDEPLPGFQDLLEPLPLIVRDLPDIESQNTVELYDQTTYSDLTQSKALLDSSISAVEVPVHLNEEWQDWISSSEPYPIPEELAVSISNDPLNGDRLSNLAMALFFHAIATEPGAMLGASYHAIKPAQVTAFAVRLFPDSRSLRINSFYFRFFTQPWSYVQRDLEAWMRANPGDITLLRLVVEKSIGYSQTTQEYQGFSEEFLQTFLVDYATEIVQGDDPGRASLGYALLGDLQLGSLHLDEPMGNSRFENAPFAVIASAKISLGYYDLALQYSDDPTLYLARSLTLSLIGDSDSAITTLEHGIEIHPTVMSLRGELSILLLAKRGSPEEIREYILRAREIERQAIDSQRGETTHILARTRVVTNWVSSSSQVANTPLLFSDYKGFRGGGGGYGVAFDLIPEHIVDVRPDLISMSVALGDPQGVVEDAERLDIDSVDYYVAMAQLVSSPETATEKELQDSSLILSVTGWLRFAGKPEEGLALCESALEVSTNEWTSQHFQNCIGTGTYLIGDYEKSIDAFRAGQNHPMVGYVSEVTGDFDQARESYTLGLTSNSSSRYSSQLRLGTLMLAEGENEEARYHFDEWLNWAEADECGHTRCISCVGDDCVEVTHLIPDALSNRGITRLQSIGAQNSSVDCRGDAREVCIAAAQDFDAALEFDSHNPVFLMNRAWVARLMDDHELSAELMTRALESDPSLYPVQVDMGVYAAQDGDPYTARQYFQDAVAANPDYDLGWWNLGVLEMKKGPTGIIRGQAYLARAIVRNPSLVTESLNFKTDESIYRVEITDQNQPGSEWAFSTASSLATTAFGLLGVVLVLFHALKDTVKDIIVEELLSRSEEARAWLNTHVSPYLERFTAMKGSAIALLALTVGVMILAAIVPAWRGDPGTAAASVTLAVFALVIAVVTHEFGHRLSAHLMHAELEPVQWTPGIGVSLLLLPFNLSSGPFPAQRVKSNDDTNTLWVYLFGPLANLGMAILAYSIYLMQPIPLLRMMAITQLAVMSYSLLPFEPLDGAPLSKAQPKLVGALAFCGLLFGILFSQGVL